MELDTGPSVMITPKSVWNDLLSAKPVQQTDIKLRSYSGHEIAVVGEVKVQVSAGNGVACLPVIITQLMGRNWLSVLKLNWKQIKQISQELFGRIDNLTSKYAPPFDGASVLSKEGLLT